MSIIEEVLAEEYDRSIRISEALIKDIEKLPIGSLQKKNINGKDYHYLQYRVGHKVKSDYIKPDQIKDIKAKLAKRKVNVSALKEQRKAQKQLAKALGKKYINEYSAKAVSKIH